MFPETRPIIAQGRSQHLSAWFPCHAKHILGQMYKESGVQSGVKHSYRILSLKFSKKKNNSHGTKHSNGISVWPYMTLPSPACIMSVIRGQNIQGFLQSRQGNCRANLECHCFFDHLQNMQRRCQDHQCVCQHPQRRGHCKTFSTWALST